MAVDFRALVDEVCRARPNEELDAYLILELFLERRAHRRALTTDFDWHSNEELLRAIAGPDAAQTNLSDDDFEYLVERLIERLDESEPPHQWVPLLLEKAVDERAIEPAMRLLRQSKNATDETMEARATAALNILARYQDRPEVLDAIEEAAVSGAGHVRKDAGVLLEQRARRLASDTPDGGEGDHERG